MSTVCYCLAILNVIINAQTFEDCGSESIVVGTANNQRTLTIQLERDLTNSQVRITLTGPTDKWYGFVIGQGTMGGGYGVYGSGTDTNFAVTEQLLQYYGGGSQLTSSSSTGTADTIWDDASGIATITLTRPFSVSGNGYYDFTNVLGPQCTGETMGFGGVTGSSNDYGGNKHQFSNGNQVFTSTCSCATDAPTINSNSASTSTEEPGTSTTMDDGYELCATKELLGIELYILRDTDDDMLRIAMSGPNTVWFGYGFGRKFMTGAYGVTVEADDSANLVSLIRERTLDKDSTPGTLLTPSGSIEVTQNDTIAYAMLERPYVVTNGGFDFTDFLNCNVQSINLIAGIGYKQGSGTMMGYHGNRVEAETLTRLESCICEDGTYTDDMTTTESPDEEASANNIFNGLNVMVIMVVSAFIQ